MPRGDQLTRQWRLVHLLAGHLGRTLAQLAGELGVAKRTVQRDIETLSVAGFPVSSETRNGTVFWHFMEGFHAGAPIALTLTEQMALYFSKGLFKPLQGSPIYESLESAIQKIGSQLPAQSFKFLRGLDQGISVSSFGLKDYSHSKEVIDALTRAVFNKFTVRILHRAPYREKAIEREVDPYKLWYVNNGLYLVGYDHKENALRTFAVERIQSAKLTNRRFEVPEDFNFEQFRQTAFNMIWGEPQEVKIRFSAAQAPYIRERTWHPGQKIETEGDGSIILTLHVADLDEVKRWLIGFGAEAAVLTPEELQMEIADECRRMANVSQGL
ncbi:MAG: transcriptional regulator [Terriglobia bacterium]|jgi:predicted DNA-binding transcriptional regulator YafY